MQLADLIQRKMFHRRADFFSNPKRRIHSILVHVNSELQKSCNDAFTRNQPHRPVINLDESFRLMKINFVGRMLTCNRLLGQV